MSQQPTIRVAIIPETDAADVVFHCSFTLDGNLADNRYRFDSRNVDSVMLFNPESPDAAFEISNVTIGIGFHWERIQAQRFSGALEVAPLPNGKIRLVNIVPIEEYLKSVISSEMNAKSPFPFLQAHAIISRSWALRMLQRNTAKNNNAKIDSPDELLTWYDNEDHIGFDVCADDHCQRYQGLDDIDSRVADAVESTRGQVLTHDGLVCDARFSKCCGGAFEEFSSCWQPVDFPYLIPARDAEGNLPLPDLHIEEQSRKWITTSPDAFCNTNDPEILSTVLKKYDRETPDFFRWTVSYSRNELSEIVKRRSGRDLGEIIDLIPLVRGASGRIFRLKIVGTRASVIVGKELEIRRWLSNSHLYSSAFVVQRHNADADGLPAGFTLRGAGWGHGVGLCQIGAAVMAAKGYSATQILNHYYPGASIDSLWQ